MEIRAVIKLKNNAYSDYYILERMDNGDLVWSCIFQWNSGKAVEFTNFLDLELDADRQIMGNMWCLRFEQDDLNENYCQDTYQQPQQ